MPLAEDVRLTGVVVPHDRIKASEQYMDRFEGTEVIDFDFG